MKQIIFMTLLFFATFLTTFGQDKYLDEGNKFLSSHEFDKAEKTFREGIKSDSTNLIYQCQLGLTLIQQKKYSDAEIILVKTLQIDSNNVAALWYRAMVRSFFQL